MKILLLGGYGLTGRQMAPLLLAETSVNLEIAGRNRAKAEALAAELNERHPGQRVTGLLVDAADRDSLARAFKNVDLVIVLTSSAEHIAQIAEVALEQEIDFLDVLFDPTKVATLQRYADEIEAAGRCFVTEAGFHPGLPSLIG